MLTDEEIEKIAHAATRFMVNAHDREDAMQECRIAAWRALAKAKPGRDPRPYQAACARAAVLTYLRKHRRRFRQVSLESAFNAASADRDLCMRDLLADEGPTPLAQLIKADLIGKVRWWIARMPRRMRAVAELDLEGLPTKEICKRLGYTRQAINRTKKQARDSLRRRLATVKAA